MKNYLCFQPEYFGRFKCDGSKCNANCCNKRWNIEIDRATYEQYLQLGLQEIVSKIRYDETKAGYFIAFNEHDSCPFLAENNLCRIQLDHGENFLSTTCATYPRRVNSFKNFFERTLVFDCPVAAEMVLFEREPMKFEFVQVEEDAITKLAVNMLKVPAKFVARIIDIQIAMISILQERTLSINQRLIVLGFFLDKLDEISADKIDENALTKLIAAYESKKFLTEQVPLMLTSVRFNAKKFVGLMLKIFNDISPFMSNGEKYFKAVSDTLRLKTDENDFVSLRTVVANYERLADERKNFSEQYSTFMENYLVNELFMGCCPWRFTESIADNFAVFVAMYKIFELIIFSAVQTGSSGREELLRLTDWFITKTDHSDGTYQKIFLHVKNFDDMFTAMETLLEQ